MQDALLKIVEERLAEGEANEADWAIYVLAACEGADVLADVLGGNAPARTRPKPAPADATETGATSPATEPPEPAGAYIRSIEVQGFRGIGPARKLELTAGPGLTLVVGRNGSGKSSFAEGLEILLTGTNWRLAELSAIWKQGWRNLHHPDPAHVTAELNVEGVAGTTRATRTWPDGGELDESTATIKPPNAQPAPLSTLGWAGPLETYRPFLSYNELGSVVEGKPTDIHDRLSNMLGLGELEVAQQALKDARLPREQALKAAKARLTTILPKLDALDDERARQAKQALGRKWDLDALEAVLADSTAADDTTQLGLLRTLRDLPAPTEEEILAVAEDLIRVRSKQQALAGTPAAQAHQIATLLRSAIAFHQGHGDGDCPVCGRTSALNADWQASARARVAELDQLAREASEVEAEDRAVRAGAVRLLTPPPAVLDRSVEVGVDANALRTAWDAFASIDLAGADLTDRLIAAAEPLAVAVEAFRQAVRSELARREDLWRPIAVELTGWLAEARSAVDAAKPIDDLESAEKWLKQAAVGIRQQRFEPIADQAIAYWNVLRQQSSVELERVVLEGTGPARHLTVDVTVDGIKNAALAVMSQGELHAIALSLFLPRATLPESPFRFIVIDDPVQSMDPARVDGLARVLQAVARTRQVLVFTHDDRLPEAVRRLDVDARIWEVTRHEDSVVEIRPSLDPVARNLDDARALAHTRDLPEVVGQQVVPSFCRAAIEAACVEVYRRRRIERGEAHAAVERELDDAQKLNVKLALAFFDNANRGGDVAARVQSYGELAADAWGISNRGAHAGFRGSLDDLVRGTDILCRKVREAR